MHKKTQCYFDSLVDSFARVIGFGVIIGTVEQLHSQLFKKCSIVFTNELWVVVYYQLSRKTSINKVKSGEKSMSPILSRKSIFSFN